MKKRPIVVKDDGIREEILIQAAKDHAVSLSAIAWLSRGLSDSSLAIFCDNVSSLPKYIKSRLKP